MTNLPEKIRAFIAVRIPDEVLAQLAAVQEQLKQNFQDVSWTRPEAMHLTLLFFGNIDSVRLPELLQAIENATHEFSAFDIELSGIGSFNNRVLWVGIERGVRSLGDLATALRDATKGF